MEAKWLPPINFNLLEPFYQEWEIEIGEHLPRPDPLLANVLVIIEDNRIIAFGVLQTVVHAEPIRIEKEYQGRRDVMTLLVETLKEPFSNGKGFYAFVPHDRPDVERMAVSAGMREMDWKVYEWRS